MTLTTKQTNHAKRPLSAQTLLIDPAAAFGIAETIQRTEARVLHLVRSTSCAQRAGSQEGHGAQYGSSLTHVLMAICFGILRVTFHGVYDRGQTGFAHPTSTRWRSGPTVQVLATRYDSPL